MLSRNDLRWSPLYCKLREKSVVITIVKVKWDSERINDRCDVIQTAAWISHFSEEIVKEKYHSPKVVSPVLKSMLPNLDLIPNLIEVSSSTKNVTSLEFSVHCQWVNPSPSVALSIPQEEEAMMMQDKTLVIPFYPKKKTRLA